MKYNLCFELYFNLLVKYYLSKIIFNAKLVSFLPSLRLENRICFIALLN